MAGGNVPAPFIPTGGALGYPATTDPTYNAATHAAQGGGGGGVTTFNTRSGAVTLQTSDLTALNAVLTGQTNNFGAFTQTAAAFAANLTGTSARFVGLLTAAPGSGTWLTGDFGVDPTHLEMWVCTAGGTPGSWSSFGSSSGGAVSSVTAGSANLVISPTTGNVVADLSAAAKADLALAATALQAALTSFNGRATAAATLQSADLTVLMTLISSTTTALLTVGGSTLAPTLTITSAVALVQENTDTATLTAGGTKAIPDVTSDTVHAYTFGAGNITFTFPTAAAGKSFLLALTQDSAGSRTATWPSSATCRFSGGTAPTLTTTANKTDYISFVCSDGTHWDGFLVGTNF